MNKCFVVLYDVSSAYTSALLQFKERMDYAISAFRLFRDRCFEPLCEIANRPLHRRDKGDHGSVSNAKGQAHFESVFGILLQVLTISARPVTSCRLPPNALEFCAILPLDIVLGEIKKVFNVPDEVLKIASVLWLVEEPLKVGI